MLTRGVAGNVETALTVGEGVVWPATYVREVRATRAKRVERAMVGPIEQSKRRKFARRYNQGQLAARRRRREVEEKL
jgi:hypothetical protein